MPARSRRRGQRWPASRRKNSAPAQAPSQFVPPGTVLVGIPVTRLVCAAPAGPLQDTGAEYSLHLNILFNSPQLSPLLPWNNPLAFLRKRPAAVVSPVAQGGQARRHLQSKEDTIWGLHLSPQVSGFLWSGFRAPCGLSQALHTCSLTGPGEVLSPSDRFQTIVSNLKKCPWDTVLPNPQITSLLELGNGTVLQRASSSAGGGRRTLPEWWSPQVGSSSQSPEIRLGLSQ